jgi:hypothetical protein
VRRDTINSHINAIGLTPIMAIIDRNIEIITNMIMSGTIADKSMLSLFPG